MKADRSEREVRSDLLTVRVGKAESSCTVSLAGELDMASAAALSGELERVEAEGPARITIDLSRLEFIDSTGIAVLVAAHHRLNGEAERLRLVRSGASAVQRVMEVTGLEEELPFVNPEEGVATG